MTNPAILEALTAKMEEIWNDDLSFADQAAAVLELVGTKPLKWIEHCPDTGGCSAQVAQGEYVAETDEPGGEFGLWTPGQGEGSDTQLFYPTLEAAQAAAQAHADAAHWANTKIGGGSDE